MTEKARKQKWNTGCIPLLILYIIHGVFVTAYMGEYYPEVEFAFWVAEVFLVMHAYALCRLPHKVEWNDFWGINYLCTYIPTLQTPQNGLPFTSGFSSGFSLPAW